MQELISEFVPGFLIEFLLALPSSTGISPEISLRIPSILSSEFSPGITLGTSPGFLHRSLPGFFQEYSKGLLLEILNKNLDEVCWLMKVYGSIIWIFSTWKFVEHHMLLSSGAQKFLLFYRNQSIPLGANSFLFFPIMSTISQRILFKNLLRWNIFFYIFFLELLQEHLLISSAKMSPNISFL